MYATKVFTSIGCTQNSHFTPPSQLTLLKTKKNKNIGDRQQSHIFLQYIHKNGISRDVVIKSRGLIQSNASSSPASSSNSSSNSLWKKWLMGIIFSLALPAAGHKGGALIVLKGKIDQTIVALDTVTNLVENIAEQTDKLVDMVKVKLPKDSKYKETVDTLDELTDIALERARKAEDLVEQVKEINEKIFEDVLPKEDGNKDEEESQTKIQKKIVEVHIIHENAKDTK